MSITSSHPQTAPSRSLAADLLRFVLLFTACLPIAGCDGCRRSEDPDAPEEQPEPDITVGILRTMPTHAESPLSYVKPAHWAAAYQDLKATRQDLRGVLSTESLSADRAPIPVGNTNYSYLFSRPAALAKGQQKRFDLQLFMPPFSETSQRGMYLQSSFTSRQGAQFQGMQTRVNPMPASQYYFVLLSSRPAEFSYIGDDDWQRMQADDLSDADQNLHYRVVVPSTEGVIPIPDSFLQWTSIAYVLWDDLSPETLTSDQQQAILDWVSWGGRVIVNGPAASAQFRGTLLEPLLPIQAADSTELSGEQLTPMVKHWQMFSAAGTKRSDAIDAAAKSSSDAIDQLARLDSMPGAGGTMLPDTSAVAGTNELVLERLHGRGNVVITRFDLTSGWLRKWDSAAGFYNGALLRRPPRDFQRLDVGVATIFADGLQKQTRNPQLVSGLRILSRDLAYVNPSAAAIDTGRSTTPVNTQWTSSRFDSHVSGGVAAWNQQSGVSSAAHNILQQAAGIAIPPARFVARSLIWYLAILVPLNYTIFRLIGRLEWAWIAVPVIAAGGAIWIARQAQLDIGFARSRSEIALLELQPDHDRGHLTRYIALYNSLSTTYAADFDTREAVLTPMSMRSNRTSAEQQIDFRSGFSTGAELRGINVASNKTQLLHAEQMVPLDGAIQLSKDQSKLHNATYLNLENVTVVRRDATGQLESSPLGPLQAGETVRLNFQSIERAPIAGADVSEETAALMEMVLGAPLLPRGEVRLIGRIADRMGGCEIIPQASQVQAETVVHATLRYPPLPNAKPDVSLRPQMKLQFEDFAEPAEL